MEKKPLIILTGPTAVGKSALSIQLAKRINGEIISADSMQVYKGMDIGTAKITSSEMEGIKHHLIDILDPIDEFNVVLFQQLGLSAINDIYSRNKVPIIVGGTGFYIQALLYNITFEDNEGDNSYRKELEELTQEKGPQYLHDLLKSIDSISAKEIHPNNVKRVIRALEYFHLTNKPISAHNQEERQKNSPYNFAYFVLTDDRKLIYDRINKRVDLMLEQGLIEEVEALKTLGCTQAMVSMQGIGYKEIFDYLSGEVSLEDTTFLLKRDTRHFAKRQLTWFNREKEVTWLDRSVLGTDTKILENIMDLLKERGIINE